MLTPHTPAPDFSLTDQNGVIHSLRDYQGKWVLMYFYPKDDTPGCTKQACAIRDSWAEFEKMNCVVFGISTDGEKSHKKFEEKYTLPFSLLADTEKKSDAGVWRMVSKEVYGARVSWDTAFIVSH